MAHPARPGPETAAAPDLDPEPCARNQLAEVVREFSRAWRAGPDPPALAAYLPRNPALRRVALIELIKVDLSNRWRYGARPKRLTDYVDELPELRTWPLPPDLIYEEYHLRRRAGLDVTVGDYTAAYPEQAAQLSDLLATGEYHSTLLGGDGPDRTPAALDDFDAGMRVDDFDLLTLLGRGAFARVFLARQRDMQRLVALKISHDSGSEPQTLAQLDHDYIVRVFDQRILPGTRLRLLYMQYVPGGTLFTVLRKVRDTPVAERDGRLLLTVIDEVLAAKGEIQPAESAIRAELARLSWPETVAWLGRRLASALDYAGRAGVLHRDIKPANVLLTAEGVPKLADFNISFGAHVAGSSAVANFGGSLAYMSPEQLAVVHPDRTVGAEDLDTRSDLYSLAVVLWELLTGEKPFDDPHPTAPPTEPSDAPPLAGARPNRIPASPNESRADTNSAVHDSQIPPTSADTPAQRPSASAPGPDRQARTPGAAPSSAPTGDRTTLDAMLAVRRRGPRALPFVQLPPDCPAALRRTLVRALAPEPRDRWARGADMAQQLQLCLDARARELVDPPAGSLRRRARRWMHPFTFAAIAVPNAVAILYSYYNDRVLIVDRLDADGQRFFDRATLVTYGAAFLLGIVVTTVLVARLWSTGRAVRRDRAVDDRTLARARTDSLLLGSRAVLTCFLLWAIAGVAVPMTVQVSGTDLGLAAAGRFFTTQVICGAMAMAYPYFLVGCYAVRVLYPMFLPLGGRIDRDLLQLRALRRRSTYFLVLAASVPLVNAAGATLLPPAEIALVIMPMRALFCFGAVAFVGVYGLSRMMESDIRALERTVAPGIGTHTAATASTV